MSFLSNLFGGSSIKNALKRGAIVIDVRTGTEYDRGHVPDAFNIPVGRIEEHAERLIASKLPVVICCNTGERSSIAVKKLKARGVKEVYNGGNWQNVLRIMKAT